MKKETKIYSAVAIVAIIVVSVFFYQKSLGSNYSKLDNMAVSVQQLQQLNQIANNYSLAAAVGKGAVGSSPMQTNSNSVLQINNKPYLIYLGAEYCPYCATTRWGLILAMMRFGNFSSLHYMTSSASDAFANTATFTFYNSTYNSNYIGFMSAETLTNTQPYKTLQVPNALENQTFTQYNLYDNALPASQRGGIPFIDFANYSVQNGAPVSPAILQGQDWNRIISQLNNPNSTDALAIIGMANVFTKQICTIDNNQPANVCNQPYLKQV